jgi:NADH-quinone oxidoreductase subunit H
MHYSFDFWIALLFCVIALGALQGLCAYLSLLERKMAAWVQDRIGPNRVGPLGLLQPIADGVKFLLKEQVIPSHVDKIFYFAGPAIAVSTALFAFVVVPFGQTTPPSSQPWPQTAAEAEAVQPALAQQAQAYEQRTQFVIAPHVDIGILLVLAVGSLAVYGVILGGWSSNNKYSFLGAMRSSAQIVSYEIPLGMSALAVVLLANSLNPERIIDRQLHAGWYIFYQPLAFLIFYTSVLAECNRLPFDLPETEQELVGGYHTEYSGFKFALYMLGEYIHLITTSFLVAVLFLGGWHLPWISEAESGPVIKLIVLCGKMMLFILLAMLLRWTIPRFRFDQLMGLAWKVFIPLSVVNVLAVMIIRQFALTYGWGNGVQGGLLFVISIALLVGAALLNLRPPETRYDIGDVRQRRSETVSS